MKLKMKARKLPSQVATGNLPCQPFGLASSRTSFCPPAPPVPVNGAAQ